MKKHRTPTKSRRYIFPVLSVALLLICLTAAGKVLQKSREPSGREPEMAFLQPDPEHPVVLENDSRWRKFLRIRNYGSMEITYSVYGGQRDLYLASSRDDMVLPGIAGENMEGSAVLQEDGRVWIRFVLARPHDGGTVEGIPIRFFYSPDKNTVEELHVESFTGSDNVVYTLDYTNQDALSDGAVVYEIIRTFEAFLESNEIRVGYDFGR